MEPIDLRYSIQRCEFWKGGIRGEKPRKTDYGEYHRLADLKAMVGMLTEAVKVCSMYKLTQGNRVHINHLLIH